MAEYQNTVTSSGEMAQRFVEFVLMQAQNAAIMLGQIPHPHTGKAEINIEMARFLIDQLVMIQEKTKGNLTSDETRILNGTLSNLQLAFVEALQSGSSESVQKPDISGTSPEAESSTSAAAPAEPATPVVESNKGSESESRKKFVKSYGS
jgi:Domain of unknown function (DUF1844)